MKVVHVDSARTWRGGQNQVLQTALGMARRGHEVKLACRAAGELEARAREHGLDVVPLAFGGDIAPGATWGLRRLLRRFAPDVVHVHDPHAVSAGVLAAWRMPGRLVATRRVDFHLRNALSVTKYTRCARVLAVSRAIDRVLRDDGLPPELIRVVHEGVPDREPRSGGREALAGAGIPADARLIGNVAALTDHKDHATLLDAFDIVSRADERAWLAIAGDGELRGPLEEKRRALGLERCVFLGFRRDLDALIPAFDVFCLASHMEGLGTSLLDAMCFRRPIVATEAGGIPDAVEHGLNGLLSPVRDAPRLAAHLLAVLGDPEGAAALGAAGRLRFEERFTTDRMVDATLAVYGEVA